MQSADFVCGLYFFVYVLTAFFPPTVLPYLREGIPMRTLAKDILIAAVMGLVVPGIVLSIAARQTETPPEYDS
mgnify:CR=1 FL=1